MKIRFCPRPYNHIHCDPEGYVRICSWMDVPIGNLLDEDIHAIWHGEKAAKLRESFRDGSFRFCRATSCPFLENDSLEYIDSEDYEKKAIIEDIPKSINIANDFVCNHSCPSCRQGIYHATAEYLDKFDRAAKQLIPLLNQADDFSACGNGDLFASPHMLSMLSQVKPQKSTCRISLETNGALFDEKHWDKIKHFGDYNLSVVVTPNSFRKDVYEYLSGNHNDYEKLMDNLYFIKELHEKKIINRYEISIVVQDVNYLELPDFSQRCIEDFGVDAVVVKPIYNWFKMPDEEFWFKDVLNPLHPYHASWQKMMKNPILNDSHVYLWGARNEHKPMVHPAYQYKDMLAGLNTLISLSDLSNSLKAYMTSQNKSSLILYGENELTAVLVEFLKEKYPLRLMARDITQTEIRGIKIERFCCGCLSEQDVVVVLNANKYEQIKRDFEFGNFKGILIKFPEWVEILKEVN